MVLLPADKYESFLQDDTVILGVCNQGHSKDPKYLKENGKIEVYFLLEDKHQRFLQIDTIILGVCGQACPNYPK